jgi:hypothetical protein
MEGNCEACAWIDRAQSGAISRDLAQVPRSPRGAARPKQKQNRDAALPTSFILAVISITSAARGTRTQACASSRDQGPYR